MFSGFQPLVSQCVSFTRAYWFGLIVLTCVESSCRKQLFSEKKPPKNCFLIILLNCIACSYLTEFAIETDSFKLWNNPGQIISDQVSLPSIALVSNNLAHKADEMCEIFWVMYIIWGCIHELACMSVHNTIYRRNMGTCKLMCSINVVPCFPPILYSYFMLSLSRKPKVIKW